MIGFKRVFALGILFLLILTGCASDTPTPENKAPDFTLPDSNGNMVRLADELRDNQLVILVFYHAYT
jgi:hypothetical protein